MIHKKKLPLLAVIFLLFGLKARSQAALLKKDQISLLSNGYTHVIVNGLDFPGADVFLDIFKKYWTITKGVDFINFNPEKDKFISGDSYFAFKGEIDRLGNASQISLYLQLSVAKEKSPGSEKNKEIPVANIFISLIGDGKEYRGFLTHGFPFSLDGGGHILSWNPGTVKNYLQQLTIVTQANKITTGNDIAVKADLQTLQTQPLYCTMDDFYNWGFFRQPRPDNEKELDDIFKGYEYTYIMITNEELQDKILADKEPFYYMVWITTTTFNGYVAVINSRTGELAYCGVGNHGINMERSYMRSLNRAVTKSTK